jgi:polyisoprenoid-binding protein YceI
MPIQSGTHQVGPANGTLTIKTYREGLAAKAGHDLVMEVTRWDAKLDVGPDGSATTIELSADPASIEVREGHNGVKPLSDKDRGDILKNIDKKVLGTDPISFRGSGAESSNGRVPISGDLTLAGTTRPATFELEVGPDGRVSCSTSVTQSQWGIKSYTGLMGALKVRDDVELEIDAGLPG